MICDASIDVNKCNFPNKKNTYVNIYAFRQQQQQQNKIWLLFNMSGFTGLK